MHLENQSYSQDKTSPPAQEDIAEYGIGVFSSWEVYIIQELYR